MQSFICRNLDLGRIIWLNVSRKFLSFKKFFFAENEDCFPCEFKKEIEHHSHTHTSVNTTLIAATHFHTLPPTGYTACGATGGTAHLHYNDESGVADSHSHAITIALAAGNIGALPNWQNHTHTISGTSAIGGVNHTHSVPSPTWDDGCSKTGCLRNSHSHANSTGAIANNFYSHTHTVSGNSGNGVGTCVNHTHSISGISSSADGHIHATSGNSANATCYGSASHYHTMFGGQNTDPSYHAHAFSATSGASSEDPLCTPALADIVGDGLTLF